MSTEENGETRAAEARLLELSHEVERMLRAGRLVRHESPGWWDHCELERVTVEQAHLLYNRWLDLQIRRHAEQPDVYGRVEGHNGNRMMLMLAYVAEKRVRLREIRAEVHQIRERCPSPRVAQKADEIARRCGWLEEIYEEFGDGPTFLPYKPTGLT